MRRSLLLSTLAILPVLAACGGGGGGGGDKSSSGSSGGGSSAVASACPKGAVVIHMKDIKFAPDTATAKVGQKVCWINDDDVQHDAEAQSGADFKSDLFGKGKTFTATVSKAGTVQYVCTVHPAMTGTLNVS
jgi:plastocyanin